MMDGDSKQSDEEPLHKKILAQSGGTANYGTCTNPEAVDEAQRKISSRMGGAWSGVRKGVNNDESDMEERGEEEKEVKSGSKSSSEEKKDTEKKEVKKEEGPSRSQCISQGGWMRLRVVVSLFTTLRGIREERNKTQTRTKSNQRWMKLRTTVQLSGAITSTLQKSKAPLKREDSFMKRFSTRQVPDMQETMDTGEDTDASTSNGGLPDQDDVNRRRMRRRRQSSRFVVNPDNNFYFYWLMLVAICVLYNLWVQIVRQSFPELQELIAPTWIGLDLFADTVFLLDLVVQFRTGYLEQGLMVYDWKKLSGHYMKSRDFVLDVIALTPLDILQFFIGTNPILRFPRFLKTYRLYDYYYLVESRTVYPNLWRVANLVHILLILAHWFGCFYYLLSEAEGFRGDWVYPYSPGPYSTLSRKYLASVYWSTLTLTTIGDLPTPETDAETRGGISKPTEAPPTATHNVSLIATQPQRRRGHKSRLLHCHSNSRYIFTIISYLCGVFIFATIVGQVGNVITNRNANRLEFERLLDGAKLYMRHHKVPGGMKRRVLRWYDYSWSRGRINGGGDINTALGLLPDKLKTELALHVNLSVLKKVTIFQECQPEFLHDLVLKMKAFIFTPGDLICRKGEVAREMFIIADGVLDVISENGRVLTTMKAGDFFGEIGILNLDGLNRRTADVRSVGYSELFSLSREDVLNAIKDYPEAEGILQALGRKRLLEARNAAKIPKKGKDQDGSSAESDAAGKRIVEKLKSDVKGLKNALQRNRHGTSSKDKQSTLQRMGNVHSSDEIDVEPPHSPIGPGLPLLQRLKLLKEKQERDSVHSSTSHSNKEQSGEVIGAGLPLIQRLRLLKQKEDKEPKRVPEEEKIEIPSPSTTTSSSIVTATVHTQQIGVKFEKKQESEKFSPLSAVEEPGKRTSSIESIVVKKKEGGLFRDALRKLQPKANAEVHEGKKPSQHLKELEDAASSEGLGSEIKANDVIKSKDSWSLLKKSSLRPSRAKKSTYLSKSDTILERRSEEEVAEKRSRSASPAGGKRSLKGAVENIIRDRRRTKSLTQAPRSSIDEDVNAWEFPALASQSEQKDNDGTIKNYDSVDDLSPEYSGLPFVKRLQILNERLEVVPEDDIVVRSASLDVPERTPNEELGLIRSQSEASAFQPKATTSRQWPHELFIDQRGNLPADCIRRSDTIIERTSESSLESSIQSPECNETLERRNLKSILKRLSAEEHEEYPMKKVSSEEMRKLLRAPTIEGYAARHSKLTKSVTFNKDTLQSPPASPLPFAPERPRPVALRDQPIITEKTPSYFHDGTEPTGKRMPHYFQHKKSQEDEIFRDVVVGIKQLMQSYLEDIEMRFQAKFRNLEVEVRRRDEVIARLQSKLQVNQSDGTSVDNEEVNDGDNEASLDTAQSSPISREVSFETVIGMNSPSVGITADSSPLRVLDSVHDIFEPPRRFFGYHGNRFFRRHSDQEAIELLKMSTTNTLPPLDIRRAKSIDEARRREYVTLTIADSDSSYDSDAAHNGNWEVQMLIEEQDRRNSNNAQKSLEDIGKELKKLNKVVNSTDLTRLSCTELRVLETIIDANNRKIDSISEFAVSDGDPSTSKNSLNNWPFKPLGQALSFDFHDVDFRRRMAAENIHQQHYNRRSMPNISTIYSPDGLPPVIDASDSVFEEELCLTQSYLDHCDELPDPESFLRRVSERIAASSSPIIEDVTDEENAASCISLDESEKD